MRRTATFLTVGALLLGASACSSSDAAVSTTASSDTSASSAPAPGVTASNAADDTATSTQTASTKSVCTKVEKLLEGKQMKKFGTRLGQMIVYKQAKNTAKAKAARVTAGKDLLAFAKEMRTVTATAKDAEVRAAGEEGAVEIEKTAANDAFYAKIKTVKDVDKSMESEITPWLTPLSPYCA